MTSKARFRAAYGSSTGLFAGIAFGVALVAAQAGFADSVDSPCPAANCTSNDMQILAVAAAAIGDPTCDDLNDTVQVEVTHTLDPNANERFDVGLYVAVDGEGQQCKADLLHAPEATGATFDKGGGDCPDINGEVTHVQTYTVPCVDDNDNGLLDVLLICQSWTQNESTIPACTHANVFEGTAAKCNCVQVNANIPIGAPAMNKYGYAALGLLLISAGVLVVRKGNLI